VVVNIHLELKGIDKMQKDLETFAKRSVPFAARSTINDLAFAARKIWAEEMDDALTLRNKFTARRALVERCTTLKMSSMEAVLGHTEPYMALLERGGSEPAAKHFRPIPTEIAAGQARGSLSSGRKKPVKAVFNIRQLGSLRSKAGGGSRQAKNARAVRAALKTSKRLALLDMGRKKGIYRIGGSKRNPLISKVYDLTRRVTPVPRIPTLQRTLVKALGLAPSIAHACLLKQLQRNKIAGY
jgi:hypothetical protein